MTVSQHPQVAYLHMGGNSMVKRSIGLGEGVVPLDIYQLEHTDLSEFSGILISMNADQQYLKTQKDLLENFIFQGGKVVLNGHPVVKFLPKQGDFRLLHYSAPEELFLTPGDAHPVWTGVDLTEASMRKGITGFYARGYTLNHPAGALITTRIGQQRLPLDYVYTHGLGRILIHPGIEPAVFLQDANSAARIHPQLIDWMMNR